MAGGGECQWKGGRWLRVGAGEGVESVGGRGWHKRPALHWLVAGRANGLSRAPERRVDVYFGREEYDMAPKFPAETTQPGGPRWLTASR
jgi:hypothetical protein